MPIESQLTSSAELPVLRVNGPSDLIDAVPFLLGFHPADSLVLVGMSAGRVIVTARLDLDGITNSAQLSTTVAAISRGGADELVGLIFDERADPAPLPWRQLAQLVADHGDERGVRATDVLLVGRTRWWSYLCTDAQCCPAEGRPLNSDASAVSAAATFAGLVALPDRASVEALLTPLPQARRDALRQGLDDAEQAVVRGIVEGRGARDQRSVKRALFAMARVSDASGWQGGVDDSNATRFGVALTSYPVRDAAWVAIDNKRLDGRGLWRELARRLPGRYAAAPWFLFGWANWRAGDGALAGMAAERALESDPGYSAADLLLAALSHGIDPRRLPKLRSRSL